jgi:competence protein ComEC
LPSSRFRVLFCLCALIAAAFILRDAPLPFPAWAFFIVSGLLSLLSARLPANWWGGAIGIAFFIAALGWMQLRWHEQPHDSLGPRLTDSRQIVTIRGEVITTPRPRESHSRSRPGFRFEIRTREVLGPHGWQPASGRWWATYSADLPPAPGDRVQVTGLARPPEAPSNPGEPDLRLYAAQQGYIGLLAIESPALLSALGSSDTVIDRAWWDARREEARARVRRVLIDASGGDASSPRAALLLGLLTGEFVPGQDEIRDAFARTGLAHIISISGFHIVIFTMFLSWTVRALEGGLRLPVWFEPVFVALCLVAFMAVVVPSAPVIRSIVMVGALIGLDWTGRRYDRLTILGWIVIGLIIWRPLDLWSLGFQLSAGLTATLIACGNRFKNRLVAPPIRGLVERPKTVVDMARAWSAEAIASALLCCAVSAPIVMFRIGVFNPYAPLATIFLSPLVALVLVCGYVALLAGLILPSAGAWSSGILSRLVDWTIHAVQWCETVPGTSITMPPVGPAFVLVSTTCILLAMFRPLPRSWVDAGAAVLLSWVAYLGLASQALPRDTLLRIHALHVSSGTCMLVRSSDECVLWDCGSMSPMRAQQIVAACRALGVWRVPVAVVTHPDADHFGMLGEVAPELGVRHVLTSNRTIEQANQDPNSAAATLLSTLSSAGINVQACAPGSTVRFGNVSMEFISPPAQASWERDNDHSLVARVLHDSSAVPLAILCGDVEDAAIAHLRLRRDLHGARIMEVPHHGSPRAAAISWVAEVRPGVILQSSDASRLSDGRWSVVRQMVPWLSTAKGACWAEVLADGTVRCGPSLPIP